jgi:hypothetical protein
MEKVGLKFMTREELIQRLDRHKKFGNKSVPWGLGFFVVLCAFAWWSNYHEDLISENVRSCILLFGLIGGLYGWLFVAAFFGKRERLKLELFCPKCKSNLIGLTAQIVIASGRYGKCGSKVLDDVG